MMVTKNNTIVKHKTSKLQSVFVFLACLIFSFGFWIYAKQSNYSNYEQTFNSIPVTLLNTQFLEDQTGLSVISGDNASISVTLIGKKEDVTAITSSNITASADVSTLSSFGSYSLNVSVRVDTTSSVSVKAISSSTITVYVDEMSNKTIPVEIRVVRASLPLNYVIDNPTSSVSSVVVSGPKSTIATITSAVAKVDLDNQLLVSSVNSICPLVLLSSSGSEITNPHLTLDINEVDVSIPVLLQKEVPLVVNFKNDYISSSDYTAQISPEKLTIIGDPKDITSIDSILITSLDPKLIESSLMTQYPIPLPSGVRLVDNISSVSVSVTLSPEYISSAVKIPITSIKVVNGSIPYSLDTSTIELTVRASSGNSSKLMYLSADNIEVLVDFADYCEGDGTVYVPCSISFSSQFSSFVYEVGKYYVQVRF